MKRARVWALILTTAASAFTREAGAVGPTAAFRTVESRAVGSSVEGAVVIAASSANASFPAANLLNPSASLAWYSANGALQNQWVRFELAPGVHLVDEISLAGRAATDSVRDFEIWVSSTGLNPTDFRPVFRGRSPQDAALHRYVFAPVLARYVELRALSNWGSATRVGATTIDVLTAGKVGGDVARNGTIAGFSNAAPGTATRLIDGATGTSWNASGALPHFITVDLEGDVALIDRVSLFSGASTTMAQNIEVRVSLDGINFTTATTGTLPRNLNRFVDFTFAPVPARYVRIQVLNTHGSTTSCLLYELRVYSRDRGGPRVAFAEQAIAGDAPLSTFLWTFGDGTASSERHPAHVYAAGGTYLVTLSVIDSAGLLGSAATYYTALADPLASFTMSPDPTTIGVSTQFTDTSQPGGSLLAARRWWVESQSFSSTQQTFNRTFAGTARVDAMHLEIDDDDGRSARTSRLVFARSAAGHTPPRIVSSPPQVVIGETSYSYAPAVVDGSVGDTVTYTLEQGPAGMQVASGIVTWTPDASAAGLYFVRVRATDAQSTFDIQPFNLLVLPRSLGQAPYFDSTPPLAAFIGQPYEYATSFVDPNLGDDHSFNLIAGPPGMSVDPNGVIEWTPTALDLGTHPVIVRVSDLAGGSDEQLFLLTVFDSDGINDAPWFVTTPLRVGAVGAEYRYHAMVHDPDFADAVTFSLLAAPSGMTVSSNGILRWQPQLTQWGAHAVALRATDQSGAFADQAFTVSVLGRAPIISSNPPTSIAFGATYSHQVTASDPDAGDRLTFSLGAAPRSMSIHPTTGAVAWIADASGPHAVELVVSDSMGLTARQLFTLTVAPPPANHAPSFTSVPPLRAVVNHALSYDANASDPDGDPLSYSLANGPVNASVASSTGMLTWTPTLQQVGAQTLAIAVSDGRGGAAEQSFSIEVLPFVPPSAGIGLATPRNLARLEDGASVVAFSNATAGFPATAPLTDNGTDSWRQTGFTEHSMTIALAGGEATIDRAVMELEPCETAFGYEIEVRTSLTGAAGSFVPVAIWDEGLPRAPAKGENQLSERFIRRFEPIRAAFVQLWIERPLRIRRFEVWRPAPDGGGIASLFEAGSGVLQASGAPVASNPNAIDGWTNSIWGTIGAFPHHLTVELAGGLQWIDRAAVIVGANSPSGVTPPTSAVNLIANTLPPAERLAFRENWWSAGPRHIEVAVSATGLAPADFQVVFTGEVPLVLGRDAPSFWAAFAPVQARHVRLRVLDNHGGPATALLFDAFRVFGPTSGGSKVVFSARAASGDAPISGVEWDFGNGQRSTLLEPSIELAPGVHPIALAVQDANGMISTTAIEYTVHLPPAVAFSLSPPGGRESGATVSMTDTTAYGSSIPVVRRWNNNFVCAPASNGQNAPQDSVLYSHPIPSCPPWITSWTGRVALTVVDQHLLESQLVQPYHWSIRDPCGPGYTPFVPTTISAPDQFLLAGSEFRYVIDGIDGDASSVVTHSLNAGPPGMTVDPTSGEVVWDSALTDAGTHQVAVNLIDSSGPTVVLSFRLFVVAAPGSPQISSQPPLQAVEGQLYTYALIATDPDRGDALAYEILSGPAAAIISDTGFLSWTPTHDENGPNPFLIEVRDSTGRTVNHSFTVTVAAVNTAPVFAGAPPSAAFAGQPYSATLQAADDVPGETITFARVSGPAGLTVSNAGLISWTPSAANLGPHPVVVSATDTENASTQLQFTLQVFDTDGANDPPQISSAPLLSATEGVAYSYPAAAFDPDPNDQLAWSVVTGPSGLTIAAATGAVFFTPGPTQLGNHAVTLRVSDLAGAFDDQPFTISVAANPRPPVFSSTPLLASAVGVDYLYVPSAQDPNLDPVDYLLTQGPSGMTLDAQDVLRWRPTIGQIGSHPVVVAARDPGGLQSTQSFTVIVRHYPQAPLFTTSPALGAIYVGERLRHSVSASDADPNDVVTLALSSGPTGLIYASSSREVLWTPSDAQLGPQSFVLSATDLGLNRTLQASSLTVRSFSLPEITSVPPTHARPNELYRYAIQVSDPDPGDTVQVTLQSGPSGLALVTGPALEWTPTAANLGAHPIVIEARDQRGGRATQAFTLTVANNQPPLFTSTPPTAVEAGAIYAHQLVVTDDGPAPLNLQLIEAPAGLSLSASRMLSWATHLGDRGRHTVQLRATDGLGLSSDLSFEVIVRLAEPGPVQVPSNPYCAPVSSWSSARSQLELEVISIVNQVRAQGADCDTHGVFGPASPLVIEPTLRCAARVHSQDMFARGFFDHLNPDGQGPGDRASLAGYPDAVGENISAGSPSASVIVDGLIESDGHCANLMNPAFQAIGVGYHPGGGAQAHFYTQVFGASALGNRPPEFPLEAPLAILAGDRLLFYARGTDPEGEAVTHQLLAGPLGLTLDPAAGLVQWVPSLADLGQQSFTVQATDASGGSAVRTFPIQVLPRLLPPDPSTIAPPLPATEVPAFAEQVSFLWSADPPVQHGINPTLLTGDAVSVVRGRVLVRDGGAAAGVRIRVAQRPELGFTLSRSDGRFDLAVLGGDLVLEYQLEGHIPAERAIAAPWSDYVEAPEVALVPYDAAATQVAFGSGTAPQIARSTPALDDDGSRRASLLLPAGTQAELVLPGGSRQALASGNLRATELTVGPDGARAMPAELPLGTGYTYAVELSLDEAVEAGATGVEFSTPVPLYVDNFLGFPTGGQVPIGYYDRQLSTWVPEEDGRIVEVLSTAGGIALLDVDGSGSAASAGQLAALGITAAERQQLAQLYFAGDSLWRVRLPHFSMADLNWPSWCQGGGGCRVPRVAPRFEKNVEDDCERAGSIIECQNQTLGESLGVAGTGMSLEYRSDRVPGRESAYTVEVPVTGSEVPDGATAVRVAINIAGRVNEVVLPPTPNQTYTHVWDGRDAYGRLVLGKRRARVRVAFDYPSSYNAPQGQVRSFGLPGQDNAGAQIQLRAGRSELSLWAAPALGEVGTFDSRAAGLGGWTLSAHHLFDPVSHTVFFGDGTQRAIPHSSRTPLDEVSLSFPRHLEVADDGRIYVADAGSHAVWRLDPSTGSAVIVAGNRVAGFSGDGGPATMARLNAPNGVALDRAGNLYIADSFNHRIRRVSRDGIIETIAGTGQAGFDGEVGVAPLARFNEPRAIDVGPDGSIYVADFNNRRVRRIRPGATPSGFGMVVTVVGGQAPIANSPPTEGLYAPRALLNPVYDVAVNERGDVYFVMFNRSAVFRVRNDHIEELAGCATVEGALDCDTDPALILDGGDPFRLFFHASGLALDGEDLLLTTDTDRRRVLRVTASGRAYHLAGDGTPSWTGYGPRTEPHDFDSCLLDVAIAPDKSMYLTTGCGGDPGSIITVGSPLQISGDVDVVSQDGSAIFRFSETGQHLTTIDTLTAETLLSFGYSDGYLTTITDAFTNTTTIERDSSGDPLAMIAPFGQRTELSLDANGFLDEITDPAASIHQYGYTPLGLMNLFTDPLGTPTAKLYSPDGRLIRDDDGGGGFQTLTRSLLDEGYQVERSTALGRTTRFQIEQRPDGTSVRTVVSSNGVISEGETRADGTTVKLAPNGVRTTSREGPDPRFGMDAPMPIEAITEMPSGLRMMVQRTAEVTLADPDDPLSLVSSRSTISVNGRTSTTTYVAATRLVTTVSPLGRTTESVLDAHGRVVEERVPGMLPVFSRYDARGRLYETQQGTRITTRRFDTDGYLDELEDPLHRIASFDHDGVGRTVLSEGPDGRTTSFDYDGNGNLLQLTPPFRPFHEYVYDPRNLETEYRPPLLAGMSMPTIHDYNLDQEPTTVTLADGRQLTFSYLSNGVLDRLTMPEGDTVFAYHPTTGEVQSIASPSGVVISYARDGDLLTDVVYSGLFSASVHHEYDDVLRVVREDVSGGNSIAFAYDDDGIATQVGAMTLVPRIDNGLLESTQLGVISDSLGFNGHGELETYTARVSGISIYQRTDLRDDLGRIYRSTAAINGITEVFDYAYDLSGRLEEVRRGGVLQQTYGYDGNDNRTSVTDASGARTATIDDQDRLQTFGDFTYTYLATGHLATRTRISTGQVTTYDYDVKGNLLSVDDGATRVDYAVDGTDRRVTRRVNGVLNETYVWSGDAIAASIESGTLTRYVYATAGVAPDYFTRSGVTYRLLKDSRGSVRLVVNTGNGSIAQRLDYDPFGEVITDTSPGFQPFGYAGGLYDPATRLVRFGARDYDAYAGRWTAKDPGGFQETGSLYAYVSNDPINQIDPSGQIGIVGAIASFGFDFVLELGFQLLENGFNVDCLDYGEALKQALIGAAAGAVGVGVLKSIAKAGKLASRLGPKAFAALKKLFARACCFPPETLVATPDGLVPIIDLNVGDLVLAMDEGSGDVDFKPITEFHIKPERPLVSLYLEGTDAPLRVTPDHPFWQEGVGWVDAGYLEAGVRIHSLERGWMTLSAIGEEPGLHKTYNLTVADYSTFVATEDLLWVHNCGELGGIPLGEAKRLLSRWSKGSFKNRAESIRYHATEHGSGNIAKYLRKADSFNPRGATRIGPRADGTTLLTKGNNEFLITDPAGNIVSYGKNL